MGNRPKPCLGNGCTNATTHEDRRCTTCRRILHELHEITGAEDDHHA